MRPVSPAAIPAHDSVGDSPLDPPATVFGASRTTAARAWSAAIAIAFLLSAVFGSVAKRRVERARDVAAAR